MLSVLYPLHLLKCGTNKIPTTALSTQIRRSHSQVCLTNILLLFTDGQRLNTYPLKTDEEMEWKF